MTREVAPGPPARALALLEVQVLNVRNRDRVSHPGVSKQQVPLCESERPGNGRPVAGIEPSVGSRGDSYDNALAETINGLYKAEIIHRRGPWKTKQAVELATLEWVAWFNHHRLMGPLGHVPPAEFEANYHRQRAGQAATV